ncbi:hypothetical protein T484DRAFT_3636042 [Baffinella frigidus]|nr:hypothetical protein T484DRAFT_3636042 [Cryptophyta sp. CCMP2293]
MEFGRAKGRSVSPPAHPLYSVSSNVETLSPGHKKSKHKHDSVASSTTTRVETETVGFMRPTANAETAGLMRSTANVDPMRSTANVDPMRSTANADPMRGRSLHPFEFPHVPSASRGATPAFSEASCSQRSPSPAAETCGGRRTVVIPHTHALSTSVLKPCYMCLFAEEVLCVQYTTFILNETARSSRNQIARQVADDIVSRDLQMGRSPSEGASVADIERHIALHMLSPAVKVPELIRELDDVRRLMRASITNVCPDTGAAVVDTGNVALYLRVVREQIQIYKMGDIAKLSLASAGQSTAPLATDL